MNVRCKFAVHIYEAFILNYQDTFLLLFKKPSGLSEVVSQGQKLNVPQQKQDPNGQKHYANSQKKNPAYRRQSISQLMRIVAPIPQ